MVAALDRLTPLMIVALLGIGPFRCRPGRDSLWRTQGASLHVDHRDFLAGEDVEVLRVSGCDEGAGGGGCGGSIATDSAHIAISDDLNEAILRCSPIAAAYSLQHGAGAAAAKIGKAFDAAETKDSNAGTRLGQAITLAKEDTNGRHQATGRLSARLFTTIAVAATDVPLFLVSTTRM